MRIESRATDLATWLLVWANSKRVTRLAQADIGPQEEAVRRHLLTQFPLLGRAPTRQEIMGAMGLPSLPELERMLERLHAVDALYLDPESRAIRVAYPYSAVPTRHVVRFAAWDGGHGVYAACAVDALGIPFMVGRQASIASSCSHSGVPITMEVQDQAIVTVRPSETVVWVGTRWAHCAATSCCPTMNFFCSPRHVEAWRRDQPGADGHALDLGEALYLGKGIFGDFLQRPQGDDLGV